MPRISTHGFAYDPFPRGHYIHPFHDDHGEYYEDEGREHPRTVRFLFAIMKLCGLTGDRRRC